MAGDWVFWFRMTDAVPPEGDGRLGARIKDAAPLACCSSPLSASYLAGLSDAGPALCGDGWTKLLRQLLPRCCVPQLTTPDGRCGRGHLRRMWRNRSAYAVSVETVAAHLSAAG